MSEKYFGNKLNMGNTTYLREVISKYILNQVPELVHNYELYKGKHKIEDRVVMDTNKPNNKLTNDFYGYIIDTTIGYFLGSPIQIQFENKEVELALNTILQDNFKDDLFMEIGKEMCIKGHSALMVYQNEQSETKLVRLPKEKVIFIYDEDGGIDVVGAIRFYNTTEFNRGTKEEFINIEVYTDTEITHYRAKGTGSNVGELSLNMNYKVNPQPHIYGVVPIIDFQNNEEGFSDLQKVESLVDDYDRILSDSSNEQEAYRNAYLMIKNMVLNEKSLQRLKEEGIIEVDDDGDVKFVTKNIQDSAIQSHLDRLSTNIFKFAQTPDLSDEKFAGNLSGVAIRFKMFGLETKCIIKERKMNRAIRQLVKILSVPLKVLVGDDIDHTDADIIFTRNLPANLTEIVDTVVKLNGVVDQETLLSLLPFIPDTTAVIEALNKEQDSIQVDVERANNGSNLFKNVASIEEQLSGELEPQMQ